LRKSAAGTGILTGAEYLLAKFQGCKFTFHNINLRPFSASEEGSNAINPFETIIKIVQ
jgi:hypothetical protein